MMVIKRVSPLSFAKIQGAMGALVGLLIGLMIVLVGGWFASIASRGEAGPAGLMFGAGAVGALIVLPIFYGVCGFIFGLIGAAFYNWVASMVGGVEIETS
jgi:hypothetical protein